MDGSKCSSQLVQRAGSEVGGKVGEDDVGYIEISYSVIHSSIQFMVVVVAVVALHG